MVPLLVIATDSVGRGGPGGFQLDGSNQLPERPPIHVLSAAPKLINNPCSTIKPSTTPRINDRDLLPETNSRSQRENAKSESALQAAGVLAAFAVERLPSFPKNQLLFHRTKPQ